ncbi:hypothetical protein [Oceanobacillus rekensis]|uniref:hypothetical protein n=1 Tax=Oceanobacillus rekensis TaxID=937927 RepID=UPI000B43899A|nr:hypothetical protein [Oceanobacillus rekensis]
MKSIVVITDKGFTATRKKYEDQMHHTNSDDDMDKFIPSGKYILPGGKSLKIRIRDAQVL